MTTFVEPLPGLLDDPLLQLQDLPPHADVRIPPLRDPFPFRAFSVPSPLEPITPADEQIQGGGKLGTSKNESKPAGITARATPAEAIPAGDLRKTDLTIRALVETNSTKQLPSLLPPSFVNLAAVENSSATHSWPAEGPQRKRTKLEHRGDYLQLPVPRQKETSNRVPLLPAIVNGIHEPPPSAAILPPMELEDVKAMLSSISEVAPIPPEKMLNPAEPERRDLANQRSRRARALREKVSNISPSRTKTKSRPSRAWKKWSDEETQELLKGIRKHGVGKWKEICDDPELRLPQRRPVDLKDRFRICFPSNRKESDEADASVGVDHDSNSTPSRIEMNNLIHGDLTLSKVDHSPITDIASHTNTSSIATATGADGVTTSSSEPSLDFAAALRSRAHQRVRKLWTEEEHENLMKGFGKHGYQWTAIRNDPELNLSHRKATDIRDKFRSRFPQQYLDAAGSPTRTKKSTSAQISASKDAPKPHLSAALSAPVPAPPSAGATTSTRHRNQPPQKVSNLVSNLLNTPSKPPPSRECFETVDNATAPEASSVNNLTLPSLTLGDNDWDWEDNKLAPLLDWEEFGL